MKKANLKQPSLLYKVVNGLIGTNEAEASAVAFSGGGSGGIAIDPVFSSMLSASRCVAPVMEAVAGVVRTPAAVAVAAGAYVVSSAIKADQSVISDIQSQIKIARDLGVSQDKINAVLSHDYGSGEDGLTDFSHNNRMISLGLESIIVKQQKALSFSTSSARMPVVASKRVVVDEAASKPKALSTPIPPVDNSGNVETFPEASSTDRRFDLPGFSAYPGSWGTSKLPGFVAHEQNWQDSIFEKSKAKATTVNAKKEEASREKAASSGGDYDPGDDSDKKGDESKQQEVTEFKTSNFKIGDNIGLQRFTIRFEKNKFRDPKTGQYIQKDRALNSGSGPHDGELKLFNKGKKKIGTITKDGRWLR